MGKVNYNDILTFFKEKGYHYGEFQTNSINDNLFIDFSTGYNGRGDWVELRLGSTDNDIKYGLSNDRAERIKLSNEELLEFIENKFGGMKK